MTLRLATLTCLALVVMMAGAVPAAAQGTITDPPLDEQSKSKERQPQKRLSDILRELSEKEKACEKAIGDFGFEPSLKTTPQFKACVSRRELAGRCNLLSARTPEKLQTALACLVRKLPEGKPACVAAHGGPSEDYSRCLRNRLAAAVPACKEPPFGSAANAMDSYLLCLDDKIESEVPLCAPAAPGDAAAANASAQCTSKRAAVNDACAFNANLFCYAEAAEMRTSLREQSRLAVYYGAVALLLITAFLYGIQGTSFVALIVLSAIVGAWMAESVGYLAVTDFDPEQYGWLHRFLWYRVPGAVVGFLVPWVLAFLNEVGPAWLLRRWTAALNVHLWEGPYVPPAIPMRVDGQWQFNRWLGQYDKVVLRAVAAAAGMTAAFLGILFSSEAFRHAALEVLHRGVGNILLEIIIPGACVAAFFIDPIVEFASARLSGGHAHEAAPSAREESRISLRRFAAAALLAMFIVPFSHLVWDISIEAFPRVHQQREWLLLVVMIPLAGFMAWYCCAAVQFPNAQRWSKAGWAISGVFAIFALPVVMLYVVDYMKPSVHPDQKTFLGLFAVSIAMSWAVGMVAGGLPAFILHRLYDRTARLGKVRYFIVTFTVFGVVLAAAVWAAEGRPDAHYALWPTVALTYLLWSIALAVSPLRRYLQAFAPSRAEATQPA